MGSVGGLLGMAGGQGGTGFSTQSGTNAGQLAQTYNDNRGALNAQQNLLGALQGQNGIQNQSNVYNQLQGVVAGQGPNPAQAQLAQATGANVANQAALMAGQRGAGANVGLMARQNAMQGANLQQQAAGQGASMQAQQSLNALGQAGGMANNMTANQIGQTNANAQAIQNEQSILQGANNANNSIQGQLANTTLGGQQAMIGGLMNSAGGAAGMAHAGMAHGGPIKMAEGGAAFGPQSMFGQFVSQQSPSTPTFSQSSGADALRKGASSLGGSKKSTMPGGQQEATNSFYKNNYAGNALGDGNSSAGPDSISVPRAAGGGKVPAMVSPGERFLKPQEARAVAEGKADPMKVGEKIPGKAKVKGDSYKNDTVPKNLDVGGIVLPKSVTESKNPGAMAKAFVDAYMKKGKRS